MCGAYPIAAAAAVTLLAFYCGPVASAMNSVDREWLTEQLNIRFFGNGTEVQVPGYMYDMYGNDVNERYDVIRNIWPTTGEQFIEPRSGNFRLKGGEGVF